MNKQEFRSLIREEIQKVLSEATTNTVPLLKDAKVKETLKKLLAARKRDPEDENAHNSMKKYLVQLFNKMKVKNAKSFADHMMEDEEFASGTVSGMIASIKLALEDDEMSAKKVKKFNKWNLSFPG